MIPKPKPYQSKGKSSGGRANKESAKSRAVTPVDSDPELDIEQWILSNSPADTRFIVDDLMDDLHDATPSPASLSVTSPDDLHLSRFNPIESKLSLAAVLEMPPSPTEAKAMNPFFPAVQNASSMTILTTPIVTSRHRRVSFASWDDTASLGPSVVDAASSDIATMSTVDAVMAFVSLTTSTSYTAKSYEPRNRNGSWK
jgi:hypothetical protein